MSDIDLGADALVEDDEQPKKKSKAPLLIGIVLFLLLGGGGFFAAFSGLAPSPFADGGEEEVVEEEYAEEGDGADPKVKPAFVALDELIVPLAPGSSSSFLAIQASIEVDAKDVAAFEALKPRFLDVLNTFLRAVTLSDIEEPSAMLRLRAQLLRRIRAVSAPEQPRDLLITSFVLQ